MSTSESEQQEEEIVVKARETLTELRRDTYPPQPKYQPLGGDDKTPPPSSAVGSHSDLTTSFKNLTDEDFLTEQDLDGSFWEKPIIIRSLAAVMALFSSAVLVWAIWRAFHSS